MLKRFLSICTIGITVTTLIAYLKTGFDPEGFSQALFIVSTIYLCIGGLIYVTSAERKIIDDLGRKQGMNDQELKHVYRNVPTTQDSGYGWFDAFGGNMKFISDGKQLAVVIVIIGIIALVFALALSDYWA